jgi:hypothetical protein
MTTLERITLAICKRYRISSQELFDTKIKAMHEYRLTFAYAAKVHGYTAEQLRAFSRINRNFWARDYRKLDEMDYGKTHKYELSQLFMDMAKLSDTCGAEIKGSLGWRFSELELIKEKRAKRESDEFFENFGKGFQPKQPYGRILNIS